MYQALYRKYRPKNFDELVGQEHIKSVLKKQCEEDKISHAYLFCGTRGTGKTSSAKILAKAANCLAPVNGNPCGECENCISFDNGEAFDIAEIDAASNNSVDNIRDLREEVQYPPTVMKKRVYIIDEVHMLSAGAFNALLKTLEEPPEYVIFILATTELNKIPPTILSRCQRFEFRRIDAAEIALQLLNVSSKENISLKPEAAMLLANLADGAMRDALSLLESCVASADENADITVELIEERIGISDNSTVISMFEAISQRNTNSAMKILGAVKSGAKDLSSFLEDMSYMTRDLLFLKNIGGDDFSLLNDRFFFTEEEKPRLTMLSSTFTHDELYYFAAVLDQAQTKITRYALNKQLLCELSIIRLCNPDTGDGTSALAARISKLEAEVELLSSGQHIPQKKAKSKEPDVPETQISLFNMEENQ